MTQISKLKAGSFVEAGTGIPLNYSESPSHGLTFHPPGTVAVGAGSSAGGHWHGACRRGAAHSGWHWQSGTVRDYGQGLGIRGQLLDWPGQGPVPGPGTITDHWCIAQCPVGDLRGDCRVVRQVRDRDGLAAIHPSYCVVTRSP